MMPVFCDRFLRNGCGQRKADLTEKSENRFIQKQKQVELLAIDKWPFVFPRCESASVEKHLVPVLEKVRTRFPLQSGRLGSKG